MQCIFCREEMNADATVCKTCARSQPLSSDQKLARTKTILSVAIAALVVCITGYFGMDAIQRSAAVNRIVQCAHEHGYKDLTADFANSQIDVGMTQTGKGWRAGVKYAALEFTSWGQASTGACFISQGTLFSN